MGKDERDAFFATPISWIVNNAGMTLSEAKQWVKQAFGKWEVPSSSHPGHTKNPALGQALTWVNSRKAEAKMRNRESHGFKLQERERVLREQLERAHRKQRQQFNQLLVRQRIAARSPAEEFATIKAAKEAGFRELRPRDYGGEQVELKGHVLVRDPMEAYSATKWKRGGFVVRNNELSHAELHGRVGGKMSSWFVFRYDQVEPLK